MTACALLIVSSALSACANVKIPDIYTYVTLPASGNGFGVSSIGKPDKEIPAKEWKLMVRRGVILMPDDWAAIKKELSKSCIQQQCDQAIGALDGLFYALDDALKRLPK